MRGEDIHGSEWKSFGIKLSHDLPPTKMTHRFVVLISDSGKPKVPAGSPPFRSEQTPGTNLQTLINIDVQGAGPSLRMPR